GGGHDRPGRRLRSGMSPEARDAHARHLEAAGEGPDIGVVQVKPEDGADLLGDRFPDVLMARDDVTVIVGREDLLSSLATLRDDPNLSFDFLSCVTAADWPDNDPRFWVVYELRSMAAKHRVRVKVGAPET